MLAEFVRTAFGFERTCEIKTGGTVECFYAFAFWDGCYWSAHRRHLIFEPDGWPKDMSTYQSDIVITCWQEIESGLAPSFSYAIGPGNDPRAVVHRNRLFVLFRGSINAKQEYYLYDVSRSKLSPVEINAPFFNYGKNWAPFSNGPTIGAVHGFDPLTVVNIDPETARGEVTSRKDVPWNPKARHDGYAVLRGGSNAIKTGSHVVGFGHATVAPYSHYPFLWSLDDHGHFSVQQDDSFVPLVRRGFGIIDPASLFTGPDGQMFLSLCCSERDWFYSQRFSEFLVPLRMRISEHGPPSAEIAFPEPARPSIMRLFACDLKSEVNTIPVPYGGKQSVGQTGYICTGPYLPLESGRYLVKIRYRSAVADGVPCARATFNRCIPGEAEELQGFVLTGTNDRTVISSFEVDAAMEQKHTFEVRILLMEENAFTLYDVEIVAGA